MPGRGRSRSTMAGRRLPRNGTLLTTNATGSAVLLQSTAAVSVGTITAANGAVILGMALKPVGATTETGIITANSLIGTSTSSVTLNQANLVSNLGNYTSNGNFSLFNTVPLTQTAGGTVDAGSGSILVDNGGVAFTQGGTLTTTNATAAAVTIQNTAAAVAFVVVSVPPWEN